jgi:hypothetical protein
LNVASLPANSSAWYSSGNVTLTSFSSPVLTPTKDGAIENGDTVNIDFDGYVDGEQFEGGQAEGYDLEMILVILHQLIQHLVFQLLNLCSHLIELLVLQQH